MNIVGAGFSQRMGLSQPRRPDKHCGKWDGPVPLCQDEEALHLMCAEH